jgi:outer membrane protein assembly factor BamB
VDAQYDCISALLAGNGSCAWFAAIDYDTQPYTGLVRCLEIRGDLFSIVHSYSLGSGAMRIGVTADGRYAAASLHSGGCALFCTDQPGTPKWTYTPPLSNLSLAYAVGITQTSAGNVVVACGTNQVNSEQGYLYVVDSVPSASEIAVPPQWMPKLRWTASLEYSANPGVCLDTEGTLVTATDGKPKEKTPHGAPPRTYTDVTVSESPGNFYLYDATTGARLWQYPTPIMNWPMVITPGGGVALGGSDDGSLYYWKL